MDKNLLRAQLLMEAADLLNEYQNDSMTDIDYEYLDQLSESVYIDCLNESAKFTILPKFKQISNQYPELNKYEKEISKISDDLSEITSENEETKDEKVKRHKMTKVLKAMSKILGIILDIVSVGGGAAIPVMVLGGITASTLGGIPVAGGLVGGSIAVFTILIPILTYLTVRLGRYITDGIYFGTCISDVKYMIKQIDKIISKTKNKKIIEKMTQQRDNLYDLIDNIISKQKKDERKN